MRPKKITNRQRSKTPSFPAKSENQRKQPRLRKKDIARKTRKLGTPTKDQKVPSRTPVKAQKLSDRASETRNRALQALGLMRREHLSLSQACRQEHIKPATFRHYVGSAVRQDKPGAPFRATKGDKFRRELQIPTAQGPTVIRVYGSKDASRIANYLNAVSEYLRTGKRKKLESFKGQTVKVNGKDMELLTDPAKLSPLAEADVLHFDQLYASVTGRG
jgi:hypothetical protein